MVNSVTNSKAVYGSVLEVDTHLIGGDELGLNM